MASHYASLLGQPVCRSQHGAEKFCGSVGPVVGSTMKYLIVLVFFFFRYVRVLGNLVHAIQIKTKLCQLVEVMMERRDDLSFCQEMKFR